MRDLPFESGTTIGNVEEQAWWPFSAILASEL